MRKEFIKYNEDFFRKILQLKFKLRSQKINEKKQKNKEISIYKT